MIDDGNTRDEFAPEEQMSIDGMPDGQEDGTLRDVVAELRVLPPVSEDEVRRIVARATAGTSGGSWRDAGVTPLRPARRWFTAMPMAAAAALVLAAGIGGYAIRAATDGDGSPAAVAQTEANRPAVPVTPAAGTRVGEAPIATQFVLEAPQATRVSVVGAFNSWDAAATPLVRDAQTGLWTVSVPLTPGRHVYAFMVDDSVMTLDPRAPRTEDPDFGASGSVVLVGAP